jgi:hypothetical protein
VTFRRAICAFAIRRKFMATSESRLGPDDVKRLRESVPARVAGRIDRWGCRQPVSSGRMARDGRP